MPSDTSRHLQTASNESGTRARKIVVGIDGSSASLAAMELAAEQAVLRDASLQVIMTWDWPLAYGRTPMLHESDPVQEARSEFEAAVASLKKTHPDVPVITVFEHGHPVTALVEASKEAELLVVGSRGHGEFVGMLLGSVSQHCAARAHCPVLIYRNRE